VLNIGLNVLYYQYMGYRYDEFAPGEIFHVFTRGVENRKIFRDDKDRERFLKLMLYCLNQEKMPSFSYTLNTKQEFMLLPEGEGLADILGYCLMTNHIHLLLKENVEGGISRYMQKLLNGYAKYFNMSQQRTGSLFVNPFRAVLVDDDGQLLHVSRYIHLNPYVADMIKDVFNYRWSSLKEYVGNKEKHLCHTTLIQSLMNPNEYRTFVNDEAGYVRSKGEMKHILIDM
jgi:putative transposase